MENERGREIWWWQGQGKKIIWTCSFYTSVQIWWLVKLIFGCCCTVVSDLECESIGRGVDGCAGEFDDGINVDTDERFRLGNGSVFPSKSRWSLLRRLGRRLVIDDDGKVILPSGVVTNVTLRFLFPGIDFRGVRDDWWLFWLRGWSAVKTANRWRFRCSMTITQTR